MKSDVIKICFEAEGGARDSMRVVARFGEQVREIYFSSPDAGLEKRPEALAAAGILPAMRSGKDLQLDSALDPVFSDNFQKAQSLYQQWDGSYRCVQILQGEGCASFPERAGGRVGLFFSGGVDSFFSLLKHQDEITDLIFVHGFDISVEDRAAARRAEESIRQVGAEFGKRVIVVETNLRSMLDEYVEWGERGHGAAIAAVAHLLGGEFLSFYISASDSGSNLYPWGSHPQLDPLWSRSGLAFVHDGCETSRTEKLRRIAESDIALQHLRVCWKNRGGALNCGRCEKCIRTMIGLKIVGALDCCAVFAKPLRLWRVCGIKIPHPDVATGQLDNLTELKEMPENRALYRALQFAFFRSRLRERFKTWGRRTGE